MALDYIQHTTTKFEYTSRGKKKKMELLWGDRVDVQHVSGSKATVRARGRTGEIDRDALGGKPLLEVYIIDVGQGDGILIVTPKRRHVMIDGGYIRSRQPTGKNAADFVDWKFFKDYNQRRIKLDAIIASHCDADHYGGIWDLISDDPAARDELDAQGVDVDAIYHAGVSWWDDGDRNLGPIESFDDGDYLTRLLGDRNHVARSLDRSKPGPHLQGEWAKFMKAAVNQGCPIKRLSHLDEFVPGFAPDDQDVSIRILAPIEFSDGNKPILRAYTRNKSQNTNGHSLLLRVDHGKSRILLTGDLNKRSMQALLQDMDNKMELQCDVTKGCHHGSDDISYEFLQAIGAAATVISSGDNEGHAHPRPTVVAASAQTGHVAIHNDEMKTPLVYSTEISRSIDIGKLTSIVAEDISVDDGQAFDLTIDPSTGAELHYEVVKAGDLRPAKESRRFNSGSRVVHGVTYGLVNVRTDGKRILLATLNEKKDKWEVETFDSRF